MPPLPKELLDKLTPEQRRKMEADIKAGQAEGPDRDTDRECITQKDIERPFESSNTKECKQTIVTTTRTSPRSPHRLHRRHAGIGPAQSLDAEPGKDEWFT